MHLQANAKLTLSLRITGVRDDGYHLIDSEMVSIDLADELEIVEGRGFQVEAVRDKVPTDATNLVPRALELTGKSAFIRLTKNIPVGAGLGGGSADAAAVLRWAGVSDNSLAVQLGADVPFCLAGGHARVTGIGEVVEPLPDLVETFNLYVPPIHVETKRVYEEWDALGGPTGENGSDLEPALLSAYPEMKRWHDTIGEVCSTAPRLAGSGSTWFVERRYARPVDGCRMFTVETVPAV